MNREILRLAIPSILANITIPLVGIADTAIVGHSASAVAIAGIAIGTMLFDLLYWNFGFLRVGTAGTTAQAYGRNDAAGMARILVQSGVVAGGAALVIWLLQWFFVQLVFAFVPCSVEVEQFAKAYFYVRVWAAPATLMLMTLKGWFIGMQNTVFPMICDIVVNVVNVVASFLFVFCTPLGALGVAHGTLLAQYMGLVLALILLMARYRSFFRGVQWRGCLRWQQIRQLFVLNSNLFVRSLCFMVVYVGFTSIASSYGDSELAVSNIVMKLFMLFSYFIDGFAYAGEALIGRFCGARDVRNIDAAVRALFVWTVSIGVFATLLYGIFSDEMVCLMTSDGTLLQHARAYRIWLALMPLASCLAFMWDGIYVGATAGVPIRNAMIWAAVGFVLCYVVLYKWFDIQALYVAYFVHLLARALYLQLLWPKTKRAALA